jgi:hypothetical protein
LRSKDCVELSGDSGDAGVDEADIKLRFALLAKEVGVAVVLLHIDVVVVVSFKIE